MSNLARIPWPPLAAPHHREFFAKKLSFLLFIPCDKFGAQDFAPHNKLCVAVGKAKKKELKLNYRERKCERVESFPSFVGIGKFSVHVLI